MAQRTRDSTKTPVPAAYYEMFALRIQGWDYKEIAIETGYSYDRVKHIFAKGGVLYDLYRDWVKNRKLDRVEEAVDLAFEHLPDIMRANIKHAMTPYEGAPMARKMIFDLTLGDMLKRNDSKEVEETHGSISELIKAATLAKQINDGSENTNQNRDNGKVAGESAPIPAG